MRSPSPLPLKCYDYHFLLTGLWRIDDGLKLLIIIALSAATSKLTAGRMIISGYGSNNCGHLKNMQSQPNFIKILVHQVKFISIMLNTEPKNRNVIT